MKKIIGMICLLFVGSVSAAPISYSYTGSWSSFSTGDFGPDYSVDVIFDNGGTDVANQTFKQADFLSVSVTSGSYSNLWLASEITNWAVDFYSDAIGQLNSGWADLNNAGGSFHFDPNWPDANITSGNGNAGYFSNNVSNAGSIVTNVPAPLAFSFLALGLAGLAFSRKNTKV